MPRVAERSADVGHAGKVALPPLLPDPPVPPLADEPDPLESLEQPAAVRSSASRAMAVRARVRICRMLAIHRCGLQVVHCRDQDYGWAAGSGPGRVGGVPAELEAGLD